MAGYPYRPRHRGQALIEYAALFAAVIALFVLAGSALGGSISDTFCNAGICDIGAGGGYGGPEPTPTLDGGGTPSPTAVLNTSTGGSATDPSFNLTVSVPPTATTDQSFEMSINGSGIPAGSSYQFWLWAYANTDTCDWSHQNDQPYAEVGIYPYSVVVGEPITISGDFTHTVSVSLPFDNSWKWEAWLEDTASSIWADSQPWNLSPNPDCLDEPTTVSSGGPPPPTPTPMPTATGIPTGTISEFSTEHPYGIAAGPDGALWFTDTAGNGSIGRITTVGTITKFPLSTDWVHGPTAITSGPDGNLWFAEGQKIGRITTSGAISEFSTLTPALGAVSIVAGPDGALWFTEQAGVLDGHHDKIGRITTSGDVSEFTIPTANSDAQSIVVGPDGALWFIEPSVNKIGRITTSGTITEFTGPTFGSNPTSICTVADGGLWITQGGYGGGIATISSSGAITKLSDLSTATCGVAGPDGNLWFVESWQNKVGNISPSGVVSEFSIPTGSSFPVDLALGSDDQVWFTEFSGGRIGRIAP